MAIMAGPITGSKVLVTLTIFALLFGKFAKVWDRVVSCHRVGAIKRKTRRENCCKNYKTILAVQE